MADGRIGGWLVRARGRTASPHPDVHLATLAGPKTRRIDLLISSANPACLVGDQGGWNQMIEGRLAVGSGRMTIGLGGNLTFNARAAGGTTLIDVTWNDEPRPLSGADVGNTASPPTGGV
jgi:hypothetical protein